MLLSAPWSVLCYYAEEISLRVPLQVSFISLQGEEGGRGREGDGGGEEGGRGEEEEERGVRREETSEEEGERGEEGGDRGDRKSTRLNSSHL